jgi:hypothetical protein
MAFPFGDDEQDGVEQCTSGRVLLDIAPENAAAIADVVGGGPNDVLTALGTPTAVTLETAKPYLDGVTDGLDKYVLLATDGAPNCDPTAAFEGCRCTGMVTPGAPCSTDWWCLNDQNTIAAAEALYLAGYRVYVLGIGDSMEWGDVMDAIAFAGGTGQYIPADSQEFEDKLTEIVGGIMTCEFDVDWESLPPLTNKDPDKVNFFCKQNQDEPNIKDPAKGTVNVIPGNPDCANGKTGWTWTDDTNTAIKMCEDECTKLKSGGCPVITAEFGCSTVGIF